MEVLALDGRPGVFSARYGGPGITPPAQHVKLLGELAATGGADRRARFVCVIALAQPGQPTQFAAGELGGEIAAAPQGAGGFGYDPLFWLPERGCTLAELPAAEKNRISHRARAAAAAHALLQRWPAQR